LTPIPRPTEYARGVYIPNERRTDSNLLQILQVLLFCIPFYDFLDQASRKAAHSFKSDTSLVDAMCVPCPPYRLVGCLLIW
jgi:hypothetical protein